MVRTTLAFLPLAVSGALATALEQRADCTNVHIFVARGNDEPYPGRQGALTDAICSHFTSCDAEHIEYDTPSNPACDALSNGPPLAIQMITAYYERCPSSQIVLTGYSQGGQTIGDVLGGGGGKFWDCVEPTIAGLDPSTGPGSKVVAALLWGDARHTSGQSYNVESGSSKNGYFPRSGDQLSSLGKWSDKLRSYCVDTDPICARGNDGHTHETYFDLYDSDAANWVAGKVAAAPSPSPAVIQSSASSSVAPSSSSAAPSSSSAASSSPLSALSASTTSSSVSSSAALSSDEANSAPVATSSATLSQASSNVPGDAQAVTSTSVLALYPSGSDASAQVSDIIASAQISGIIAPAQISDIIASAQISGIIGSAQVSDIIASAVSDIIGSAQVSDIITSAQVSDTITSFVEASSTSSALPWQSTAVSAYPYFYPVMATNTVPAGTTYSTAPTSVPVSEFLTIVSATGTPASSGFGNATFSSAGPAIATFNANAAAPVKQFSGLIVLAALGVLVL